jgi:apolipoprotein N-acyltransferase
MSLPCFSASTRWTEQQGHAAGGLWHTCTLFVFGALGLFFGQPNSVFHLPALALAFPFSLYLLSALAPSDKSAFFHCWLLALAGHAACLYWLLNPMHDVGGLDYGLAWIGVLLVAAYLACYSALAGLGMRRICRLFTGDRLNSLQGFSSHAHFAGFRPVACPPGILVTTALLAGFCYAGFEILCGVLFTGFPWLSLASAFARWPAWVQMASLIGSYGLSACFAAASCLMAALFLAPSRTERIVLAIAALVVTAIPPLYGDFLLARPLPAPGLPPLSLVMVQGNIDQNQKWNPQFQEDTINHYLGMSVRAIYNLQAAHPALKPDLVLWPETAMPFYFQAHPQYNARLRRFASEHNINLAFGTLGGESGTQHNTASPQFLYNRLYLLSSGGRISGIYDKQHLVPFGEYIPSFASSLTFLHNIAQGLDFSPGAAAEPLLLERPQMRALPALDDARLSALDNGKQESAQQALHADQGILLGVLI